MRKIAWVSRSPKAEGASTINKMRDLELGNEVREVLARMLFKVLDEVCMHETHGRIHAQQAYVTGRDITGNCAVPLFLGCSRGSCPMVMTPICSSPLIAAKVTIAWTTVGFEGVYMLRWLRLGVRYGFIKIRMKVVNFIKNHFHQKPLSSRTTFIKNHFHQEPLSSKTTFIKNHFHQKPLSSRTTFIKNHFHQKPL